MAIAHYQKALEIRPDYAGGPAESQCRSGPTQRKSSTGCPSGAKRSACSRTSCLAERHGLAAGDLSRTPRSATARRRSSWPSGRCSSPAAKNRRSSAPWPPPMPKRDDSPRRCKRPARPWTWPRNRTSKHWPNRSRPRFRSTKRELPFGRPQQPSPAQSDHAVAGFRTEHTDRRGRVCGSNRPRLSW